MFSTKPIDFGRFGVRTTRREGTTSSRDSFGTSSRKDEEESEDDFDRKMRQFEQDDRMLRAMKDDKNGAFAKRKTPANGTSATTPTSTRRESVTSLGNGSVGSRSAENGRRDGPRQTWGDKAKYRPDWIQRFQAKPELARNFNSQYSSDPLLLGHKGKRPREEQSNNIPVERNSPLPMTRPTGAESSNKGFSWQVDDDFTAGDLQVSTSPPVSFGRTNTMIDEIRQSEIDAERQYPVQKPRPFPQQRTNTKIDELRRWEEEINRQFPVTDVEDSVPLSRSTNADGQAGQIKGWPLPSDEIQRQVSPVAPRRSSPRASPNNNYDKSDGIKIPNTPVTVYKGASHNHLEPDAKRDDVPEHSEEKPLPVNDDSRDLLRRLARASSKTPSPSPPQEKVDSKPQEQQKVEPVPVPNDKVTSDDKDIQVNGGIVGSSSLANKSGPPPKPKVGFTGISRSSSTNSVASKQSVASHDPTARLEAEAKLFALDNYSERGSIRAPSPLLDTDSEMGDKDADETPQPNKFVDPMTMPTPQVTGAYVDTPATIKVEQHDVKGEDAAPSSKWLAPEKTLPKNRDPSSSPRASRSEGYRGYERQKSSSRDVRRTKSASRHRSPLKNSVKPPTVKEDLRQICMKHEIDDSELDDLTDLIMSSADPEKFVKILKNDQPNSKDAVDDQLKRLNGMSESLKTGLAGIRTAKKGIERLEDQVSRPEKQTNLPTNAFQDHQPRFAQSPALDVGVQQSDAYTYIQVPVPRIYRTEPKFRLTLAGLIVALLGLWQVYWFVEGIFYEQWGKQKFCYRGTPCRWDMDDPEYGFVIPVKLDEWLTDGAIRPHAARWLEEAQDGLADLEDWWMGTDIRDVHHQSIRDDVKKEQYWRRLEKKGFFPKWNPAPWVIPQLEAWEREEQAQEEAEARAALGYHYREELDNETDSMAKDQPVTEDSTDDQPDSWW